jgi:hypothetical protein
VSLNGLRSDLENHYPIYCVLRDEEEPRFFRYLVTFADGGLMHEFDFVALRESWGLFRLCLSQSSGEPEAENCGN